MEAHVCWANHASIMTRQASLTPYKQEVTGSSPVPPIGESPETIEAFAASKVVRTLAGLRRKATLELPTLPANHPSRRLPRSRTRAATPLSETTWLSPIGGYEASPDATSSAAQAGRTDFDRRRSRCLVAARLPTTGPRLTALHVDLRLAGKGLEGPGTPTPTPMKATTSRARRRRPYLRISEILAMKR